MKTATYLILFFFSFNITASQTDVRMNERANFDSTAIEQINTDNYPCITCEIIQSIYYKHVEELKTNNPAVYTEEERIIFNKLFEYMTLTMKDIQSRLLDSFFMEKINIKEIWTDLNIYQYILITEIIISLNLNNRETPYNNYWMKGYFMSFLDALKECPNHMIISFGINLNDTRFTFENLNSLPYITLFTRNNEPMTISDEYGPEYPQYVQYNVLSYYSLGKNYTAPCNRAYSIYKWDKSDLQSQRWIRMK